MKHQLIYLIFTLATLASCSEKGSSNSSTATYSNTVTAIQSKKIVGLATTDTFFFTHPEHKKIADVNQLDMFKLVSTDKLLICGKPVNELKYKIGQDITDFFKNNIQGTDTMNFNEIKVIDWSSDLRGDDSKLFFFNSGKLTEIKNVE